jgi:signal transduction histidine kinase
MSVISSKAPERPARIAVFHSRPRVGLAIDVAAAVLIVTMMGLMVALPGHEAGPYHIMFLAVALAYGYRIWPVVPTVAVTVVITALSGWLMISHASEGVLARAELAEIPLMPLVLFVMVWHARRRVAAVKQVERMAARQLAAVDREREFFTDASHAIRTPVTIARGHLELVAAADLDCEVRSDVEVALRQLLRMSALSNRLLALARLDSGHALQKQWVDLGELVRELVDNWSAGSDRDWRVEGAATCVITADPEWITMALDAVVENAVHFTAEGGRITVRCVQSGTQYKIVVADSGPGIPPDELPHVFDRFWHRMPPSGLMGTGLGLSMARAAVAAHGGTLSVRNGAGGGAEFELTVPTGWQLARLTAR